MNSLKILGTGKYLPKVILDNQYFIKRGRYRVYIGQNEFGEPIWQSDNNGDIIFKELDEDKILENNGIKTRRVLEDDKNVVDGASLALENSLADAGIKADDLDGIIVATVSHKQQIPSAASLVQYQVNAKNVRLAYDVNAACAGFVYALDQAKLRIIHDSYGPIAVIGAETLHRQMDKRDINYNLFSDGFACTIMGPSQDLSQNILATHYITDPRPDWCFKDKDNFIRMPQGPKIYKIAIARMSEASLAVVYQAAQSLGMSIEEIKKKIKIIIPHQANLGIIRGVARKKEIAEICEVYEQGIKKHGNNSAASIALALDELRKDNIINQGDIIILVAIGIGMATCALAIRL